MRNRALIVAAIIFLSCGLVLALVTMALATRTIRVTSHVSIKSAGLTFSGQVTASKAACDRHRRVRLYRTESRLVLGAATTSSSGHWKITAAGFAGISLGHFLAKVRQQRQGTAGTIYLCKAATSPTIPYNQ